MQVSYNRRDKFAVENEKEEKKNKTMRFVVYSDGQVINKVWVDAICWDFHIAWKQLLLQNIAPIKQGNALAPTHNLLVRQLHIKYPELQLCQDNWKIKHIATNNYHKWYNNYVKKHNPMKLKDSALNAI